MERTVILEASASARQLAGAKECVLALDLGGTKLAAALVGVGGHPNEVFSVRTPAQPRELGRVLRELVAPLVPMADGCGVVAAGPFVERGRVVAPVNLPALHGLDIQHLVADITGLETTVINDAQALALAEAKAGQAQRLSSFAAVTVSTGVGAGIVMDGRLLDGRNGNAGHFGHVPVAGDGRGCVCGGIDCLEAHIGGSAILRFTGKTADMAGQHVIDHCAAVLGRALAGLVTLLDLELIVLHGSVALGWGQPFLQRVRKAAAEATTLAHVSGAGIELSALGPHAGLIGAAAMVRSSSSSSVELVAHAP